MFGILNLNKPPGMTSRGVVNHVQRLVRPMKVGHAGTLDPLATGVLVVCVGPATRLISYVQQMPKRYRATFLLGQRSETDDVEGVVEAIADASPPAEFAITTQLKKMTGTILQRPPAYSAIKVQGRRSYALARQGRAVELAAREVAIYRLEVVSYDYPRLSLEVQCGSGTYVRAIGRDLAESLGTAAVMSELTRTAIGAFRIEQSTAPDELTAVTVREAVLSPLTALTQLPQETLTEEDLVRVSQGRTIQVAGHQGVDELVAVDVQGQLLAVLISEGAGLWRPRPNFVSQSSLRES